MNAAELERRIVEVAGRYTSTDARMWASPALLALDDASQYRGDEWTVEEYAEAALEWVAGRTDIRPRSQREYARRIELIVASLE